MASPEVIGPAQVRVLRIPLTLIEIKRDKRQRRELTGIKELAASMAGPAGQIQPIVVEDAEDSDTYGLIAGERRLTAARVNGWTHINAVLKSDLSEYDLQLIELEENVRREDLPWPDKVRSYSRLKTIMLGHNSELSMADISGRLNLSAVQLSRYLALAPELEKNPEGPIAKSATLETAYNMLSRQMQRGMDAELETLLSPAKVKPKVDAPLVETSPGVFELASLGQSPSLPLSFGPTNLELSELLLPTELFEAPPLAGPIFCQDFLSWAPAYEGPRFNLIHCDFPYGVNHQKSEQGGTQAWGGYDDRPEVYFQLIKGFCEHRDQFMAASAHVLFWFSMKWYKETIEAFAQGAPEIAINPMPLVWFKNDNTGILPDPQRGPRQVYETALLMARGDRKIVRAVGNCFPHAGRKDEMSHQSEKPVPMLKHFLSMLCDEHTRLLDPTCGGGSALRAARELGVEELLGLEINPEFASQANTRLNQLELDL